MSQTKINFSQYQDNNGFLIQSEEDWTATANASWIHMNSLDKGIVTKTTTEEGFEMLVGNPGNRQQYISLSVDAVTDGKPRNGKITLKSSGGEFCIVEIMQRGN